MPKIFKKDKKTFFINGKQKIYTNDDKAIEEFEEEKKFWDSVDYANSPYFYNYQDKENNFYINKNTNFKDIELEELISKKYKLNKTKEFYYEIKKVKNKDGSITNKKIKKKEFKKIINTSYPRIYYDCSDIEYDSKGNKYCFFNIEKTLRKYQLLFILKIIPLKTLKKLTFNKEKLDKWASKQHELVLKLNEMNAIDQKEYDRNILKKVFFVRNIATSIIVSCFLFFVFPNFLYHSAFQEMQTGNYIAAKGKFKLIPFYDNAKYLGKYCEAKELLNNGNYESSQEIFSYLKDHSKNLNGIVSLDDIENDVLYQKALNLFSNKEYENARDIFKSIYKYKESSTYFYKCSYEIANEFYNQHKLEEAMSNFYSSKDYEDSQKRFENLAAQFYNEGIQLYEKGDYIKSSETFKKLIPYNFKQSKDYYNSSLYKDAIKEFKNKNYENAIEKFTNLGNYKDSSLLAKETKYKYATQLLDADPAKAIQYLIDIENYKNQKELILKNSVILFGSWDIISINEQRVENQTLDFNLDYTLHSNSDLKLALLSNENKIQPYKWDGKKYVSQDNKYAIEIKVTDYNNITLIMKHEDQSVIYKIKRLNNALSKNVNNKSNPKEILQRYIDKKLDKNIILDGVEVNIDNVIDRIIDK